MNMKQFELHNHEKINTGFKVPEDYFDNFEDKLFKNKEFESEIIFEPKVIPLWKKPQVWISSVAAAVVVTLGIVYFQQNSLNQEISTEEFIAMEEHFTTEDYAQYLTDDDLASLEDEIYNYDEKTMQYINENLN